MPHLIASLSVTGGTHFAAAHFDFLPALNCLIGGRGTGKSGVLHLLRFALGAPVPATYAAAHRDYIRATLGAGRVTASVVTQHGASYTCSRAYGEDPLIVGADGQRVTPAVLGDLFKLDVYAQNEIETIACSPEAQLALIDRFADDDMRRISEAVSQVERRLAQNATELTRLAVDIAEEAAREGELAAVAEALKGIELGAGGASDPKETSRTREAKVQRGRERVALAALTKELATARASLDAFASSTLRQLASAVSGDLENGLHSETFRRVHAATHRVAGAIETGAGRLRAEIEAAQKVLSEEAHSLAGLHLKEDAVYQTLVVQQDADRERAAERERLHHRFEELSPVAKRLADRRCEESERITRKNALLAERDALLDQAFRHRERIAADLNAALNGDVRVTVFQRRNHASYAALLEELLHGANIRPASFIKSISARIEPRTLAAHVEEDDPRAIIELDPAKNGQEARALKILAFLRASGRLFELETARLEDAPLLELKIGDRYQPSAKVSTGQHCTCVLPILLLQSAAPLLIDQAEDNLDNAFIYDVLVKSILRVKKTRQLLIVSHNPNIPVLSDAERIFLLEAPDGHGKVAAFGTVDELRASVERVLEGGREAYLRRGERYGHKRSERPESEEKP